MVIGSGQTMPIAHLDFGKVVSFCGKLLSKNVRNNKTDYFFMTYLDFKTLLFRIPN